MLGRKELGILDQQKKVLLLESGLNRLSLRAEVHSLRTATTRVRGMAGTSKQFAPLLVVLAPLAGFLLARRSRRPESSFSRWMALARWVAPLYRLWRGVSARPRVLRKAEPTA